MTAERDEWYNECSKETRLRLESRAELRATEAVVANARWYADGKPNMLKAAVNDHRAYCAGLLLMRKAQP